MNAECAVYSAYTADEKNVFGDGGVLRVSWRSVTDKDKILSPGAIYLPFE